MEYIEIAPGLKVSRIITGLWQIADMERNGQLLDASETALHMKTYEEQGFTTFDMADHYGSSEIIAGKFKNKIASSDVQLLTKWVPEPGKISRKIVREAVEKALERMGQETLDLMQFHAWYYPDPSWLDALFYLNELKKEGLIKHIGVTNFDSAHLRVALASDLPVITNQVSFSLLDRRGGGAMKDVCLDYDVKLLAFGTLAGGFLTNRWLGKKEPQELSTWSQMKYKRYIDAVGGWDAYHNLLETLDETSKNHDVSIANIATKCILNEEHVAAVIVGARVGESEHMADNARMLDIQLTTEEKEKIRKAQDELKPLPGDCGDEYRKPPFLTASGDLSHHVNNIPKAFETVDVHDGRKQIFTGTVWEGFAGYSRAVKDGNRIFVSGTTATHGEKMIGGVDPAAQTHFVIDKIEAALESFGGSLKDVVRTRIFVNNINDWEPVARAHGARFDGINPANTLVEARLVGKGYLVEIEADAIMKNKEDE